MSPTCINRIHELKALKLMLGRNVVMWRMFPAIVLALSIALSCFSHTEGTKSFVFLSHAKIYRVEIVCGCDRFLLGGPISTVGKFCNKGRSSKVYSFVFCRLSS